MKAVQEPEDIKVNQGKIFLFFINAFNNINYVKTWKRGYQNSQ